MKTYLVVWLSGVFAGLILVERWRRAGARSVATTVPASEVVEEAAARIAASASAEKPNAAALIFAGAKADAQRARHKLNQVMPWGTPSDPSAAQLRQWSRATQN